VSRCPELKTQALQLSKDLKQFSVLELADSMSLDYLNYFKRLNSVMRGQPVSKETALETSIKLEVKLLLNPVEYPTQNKFRIKENLLAWLFQKTKIRVNILGRKARVIMPLTKADYYGVVSVIGEQMIEFNGFRIKDEIKSPNFSMSEFKSECRAVIAETATKELGIKVSSRNIETVFQL
tara:strand:+ start:350 stop:889 length:540 start_codon:yes stop_codon:yes gene_type:complete